MAPQIPAVNKINLTLNNITPQKVLITHKNKPTHQHKTKKHLKIKVFNIKIVVETIVSIHRK